MATALTSEQREYNFASHAVPGDKVNEPLPIENQPIDEESNDNGRTLCKAHLIREIASVCDLSLREAHTVLEAMLTTMTRALQRGERIELRTFGSFYVRMRPAMVRRNPTTGRPASLAPRRVAVFRPSVHLIEYIEQSFKTGDRNPDAADAASSAG